MTRLLLLASILIGAPFALSAPNYGPAGFIYEEDQVPPYTETDPLICRDGTRVKDVRMWEQKRRPELLEFFAREVYGRTPGGRPAGMHWAETSVDRSALGGKAVRREITIWFTAKKDGPKAHLLIYQPPGDAGAHTPWPVFLGLNFYGNQSVHADPGITMSPAWMRPSADFKIVNNRATEGTRGTHASRWNVEAVVARGFATATVYYGDLCEDRNEGLTRDVGALFHTKAVNDRAGDDWGAIGIWAWGLSRVMDYLESDPEIDAKRVAVHGHSRLGKAALWAGAQDPRFPLVISNESGCGGAALSRRIFGETVGRINQSFPFWFAVNFRAYNGKEDTLPADQHELIALIAPRSVYVASAEEDRWADPRGEYLGAKLAEPVYALYGKAGLGVSAMPALHQPVLGDGLAYHIRAGKHDITDYDWARYMDYADRLFRRTQPRFTKIAVDTLFYAEGGAIADFNADGHADVVAGGKIFLGPGFKKSVIFRSPHAFDRTSYSNNFLCFTDDFNADSRPDILVVGWPGTPALWYENPGPGPQGNWMEHMVHPIVDTESPVFRDVDGDGKAELVAGSGGRLGYMQRDRSDATAPWTFHPVTPPGKWQRYTHGIGLGDINGDGRPDLLEAAGWWEQPASLAGDPVWKLHAHPFGKGGAQMEVYDVNGDGRADVVTSLVAHEYGLSWFEQVPGARGEIAWREHPILPATPSGNLDGVQFSQLHAVTLADIDGDGLKDIVTGKRHWAHGPKGDPEPNAPAVLYWFQLDRTGGTVKWIPHLIDNDSGVGCQFPVADLNADGRPDIAIVNKKGVNVFIQETDGTRLSKN